MGRAGWAFGRRIGGLSGWMGPRRWRSSPLRRKESNEKDILFWIYPYSKLFCKYLKIYIRCIPLLPSSFNFLCKVKILFRILPPPKHLLLILLLLHNPLPLLTLSPPPLNLIHYLHPPIKAFPRHRQITIEFIQRNLCRVLRLLAFRCFIKSS